MKQRSGRVGALVFLWVCGLSWGAPVPEGTECRRTLEGDLSRSARARKELPRCLEDPDSCDPSSLCNEVQCSLRCVLARDQCSGKRPCDYRQLTDAFFAQREALASHAVLFGPWGDDTGSFLASDGFACHQVEPSESFEIDATLSADGIESRLDKIDELAGRIPRAFYTTLFDDLTPVLNRVSFPEDDSELQKACLDLSETLVARMEAHEKLKETMSVTPVGTCALDDGGSWSGLLRNGWGLIRTKCGAVVQPEDREALGERLRGPDETTRARCQVARHCRRADGTSVDQLLDESRGLLSRTESADWCPQQIRSLDALEGRLDAFDACIRASESGAEGFAAQQTRFLVSAEIYRSMRLLRRVCAPASEPPGRWFDDDTARFWRKQATDALSEIAGP